MEDKDVEKIDHGICLIKVDSPQEGLSKARDLLYKLTGERRNNLLFLSGGNTPRALYERLAKENGLGIAQYLMVDERYGRESYENSNEAMIVQAGLGNKGFHPILDDGVVGLEKTAQEYNRYFASLVARKNEFGKWIAIMGIGADGHTAGIPAMPAWQAGIPVGISHFAPLSGASRDKQNAKGKDQNYVESVSNFPGVFNKRVTLTFRALSKMDFLIVLAFGSAKQNALASMFKEGTLSEIPARFYTRPEVAKKTILITDQKI